MAAATDYLLINMNANGSEEKGMREIRKKTISKIIQDKEPLLIFMQEFTWKDLHKRAWKNLDVPQYFQYTGNEQAGFVFDSREVTVKRIDDIRTTQTIHDEVKRKSVRFTDFAPLSRMCICLIKSKGVPEFEFLCLSWHGPHNDLKYDDRKRTFETLIEFVMELRKHYKYPMILGGDFNIPVSKIKRSIPAMFETGSVSPYTIDMFLVERSLLNVLKLDELTGYDLSKMKKDDLNPSKAFDHTPLLLPFKPITRDEFQESQDTQSDGKSSDDCPDDDHQEKLEPDTEGLHNPSEDSAESSSECVTKGLHDASKPTEGSIQCVTKGLHDASNPTQGSTQCVTKGLHYPSKVSSQ